MTEHGSKQNKSTAANDTGKKGGLNTGSPDSPLWQVYDMAQSVPDMLTDKQIMQLQRNFGNQATGKFLGRNPDALPGTDGTVQREVKEKSVNKFARFIKGTKNFYREGGKDGYIKAGTVPGDTVIQVDESSTIDVKGKTAVEVVSGQSAFNFTGDESEDTTQLLRDYGPYFIVAEGLGDVGKEQGLMDDVEIESDLGFGTVGYADGTGTVSIPIWGGHTLTFEVDKESGDISGKVEGEIEGADLINPELPGYSYSVDLPIPGTPAYATAGIEVAPTLRFGFDGGSYSATISMSGGDHSIDVEGTIGGSVGLEVTAKAGAGVGAANIAGIDAGAFVGASADAGVSGTIKGNITADNKNGWKSASLQLTDLSAEAKVTGKAGAYVEMKAIGGMIKAGKKFTLAEVDIAKFEYSRDPITIAEAGMDKGKLALQLGDMKMLPGKNQALRDPDESSPLLDYVDYDEDDSNPFTGTGGFETIDVDETDENPFSSIL